MFIMVESCQPWFSLFCHGTLWTWLTIVDLWLNFIQLQCSIRVLLDYMFITLWHQVMFDTLRCRFLFITLWYSSNIRLDCIILWCSWRVMLNYNVKDYVGLQHSSRVALNCDIRWWITWLNFITLWCKSLCYIVELVKVLLLNFITFWHFSRVMSHCEICQGLCWIMMFPNFFLTLQNLYSLC